MSRSLGSGIGRCGRTAIARSRAHQADPPCPASIIPAGSALGNPPTLTQTSRARRPRGGRGRPGGVAPPGPVARSLRKCTTAAAGPRSRPPAGAGRRPRSAVSSAADLSRSATGAGVDPSRAGHDLREVPMPEGARDPYHLLFAHALGSICLSAGIRDLHRSMRLGNTSTGLRRSLSSARRAGLNSRGCGPTAWVGETVFSIRKCQWRALGRHRVRCCP